MKSLQFILSIALMSLLTLCTAAIIATTGLDPIYSIGFALVLMAVMTIATKKLPNYINPMAVCGKLSADITKSCTTPVVAGTKDRGIVINHEDVIGTTYAADGETVEGLTLASGTIGYQIDGQNNSIVPISRMVEQGFNNMFDHEVTMKGFDISPETKVQVNAMKDGRFMVITENFFKGVGGNAAFEIYGLTVGLEVTEIERDANSEETQGAFHFMFFTKKNKEPKTAATFFLTDYTTTKAVVDALLV